MYKDSQKNLVWNSGLVLPIWEILEKHSTLQPATEKLIKMLTNFLHTMDSGGSKKGTSYGWFPLWV